MFVGVSADAIDLHWLPPFILLTMKHLEDDSPDKDTIEPMANMPLSGQEEDMIEPMGTMLLLPEHVQLDDVLDSGGYQEEDGNEQDTSNHKITISLEWCSPEKLAINIMDVNCNISMVSQGSTGQEHPPTDGFGTITFELCDIKILTNNATHLNDTYINGCAALLYSKHISPHATDIAMFNTHNLSRIWYNADDNTLWQNTHCTRYWK
ncbi:hypothetical protein J3R83DRAFT_11804 [Lanmaoa asiatica]|nr:hypothetical protein J3R83DRAFT_11804 [Lanmaoa asiatica]